MTDFGWLGVDLLIVCVAVIMVEGVMIADDVSRLTKRARLLSERLATEQVLLKTDADRLAAQLEATAVLWQPYERVLRWLRHPLTIALLQSLARRRARGR
jgi:K+-sensing histidine kinase KdpD